MEKREYAEKMLDIINNEFQPIYKKLLDLTREFKKDFDGGVYDADINGLGRAIDGLALTTGEIYDILDAKTTQSRGSYETKIRKALGY